MAAPRKGSIGCLLICITTLALTEYAVITYLIQPLPSTRFDWLVGTLLIAPLAAFAPLWLAMVTIRITADVLTLLSFLTQRKRNIRA